MSLTVRKSEKFTIISHHVREDTTIMKWRLVVFYCFQPKWGVQMSQVRPSLPPLSPPQTSHRLALVDAAMKLLKGPPASASSGKVPDSTMP